MAATATGAMRDGASTSSSSNVPGDPDLRQKPERSSFARPSNAVQAAFQQSYSGGSQPFTLTMQLLDECPEVEIQPEWIKRIPGVRSRTLLGVGAFGVVEKCLYKPPGATAEREVAVKRVKPELLSNEEELRLFLKEASVLRHLKCRYVVEYVGIGRLAGSSAEGADATTLTPDESDSSRANSGRATPSGPDQRGELFIVQELMDGGTLLRKVHDAMSGEGSYRNADALRWAIHMALGLQHLHEAKPMVIHRDLKLENVLLKGKDNATSEAKIADFGVSAMIPYWQKIVKAITEPANLEKQLKRLNRSPEDLEADWSKAVTSAGRSSAPGLFSHLSLHPPRLSTMVESKSQQDDRRDSVSSGARLQKAPSRKSEEPVTLQSATLNLSGRTGSLLYMAPEVFKCEDYGSAVDVFSFAVILYELFARVILIYQIAVHGVPEEIQMYAQRVSRGFRPPLKNVDVFRGALGTLIADCWSQDAKKRPTMAQVVARLTSIQASGELQAMDTTLCGCSIC